MVPTLMKICNLATTVFDKMFDLFLIASHPFLSLVVIYLLYHLGFVIYYLSPFHPLAAYPGPVLGKATVWYQTYWEIWTEAKFVRQLERLHAEYGPVVRFGPNEVGAHSKFVPCPVSN